MELKYSVTHSGKSGVGIITVEFSAGYPLSDIDEEEFADEMLTFLAEQTGGAWVKQITSKEAPSE